jgi:3-oxoacyl-[acyl-carrier protein] reductase
LVTAASRGLGAAAARRFSLEGAHVVISSRGLPQLQETAARINAESGNHVFTVAADMRSLDSARKLVIQAAEILDGLDVLVTNTGGPPARAFEAITLEEWQEATTSLLHSVIVLVEAALPFLRQSSRPAILTVTSVAAKQPVGNLTVSNTIRPAVIGLTKTLSQELGAEGIRVNSILPGYTQTESLSELLQARADASGATVAYEAGRLTADVPLQRIGQPDEFANAAVFLCSPAAGFITGVALPVDGGTIKSTL